VATSLWQQVCGNKCGINKPGNHNLFNNQSCDHRCVDAASYLSQGFSELSVAHL
jgi:hypothetical protein